MHSEGFQTGQDPEAVLELMFLAPSPAPQLSEIGQVAEVGDGIAIVAGLEQAVSDELLQFT